MEGTTVEIHALAQTQLMHMQIVTILWRRSPCLLQKCDHRFGLHELHHLTSRLMISVPHDQVSTEPTQHSKVLHSFIVTLHRRSECLVYQATISPSSIKDRSFVPSQEITRRLTDSTKHLTNPHSTPAAAQIDLTKRDRHHRPPLMVVGLRVTQATLP